MFKSSARWPSKQHRLGICVFGNFHDESIKTDQKLSYCDPKANFWKLHCKNLSDHLREGGPTNDCLQNNLNAVMKSGIHKYFAYFRTPICLLKRIFSQSLDKQWVDTTFRIPSFLQWIRWARYSIFLWRVKVMSNCLKQLDINCHSNFLYRFSTFIAQRLIWKLLMKG